MRSQLPEIHIESRDYWFKLVDMLQQNWALIDKNEDGAVVWFFNDGARVFDQISFASIPEAEVALRRNGFKRYTEDSEAGDFLALPQPPFRQKAHPNGPIYSSGRFWK